MPALETVLAAVVVLSLHRYVPPPVAVSEILVWEQVSSVEPVLLVIPAVGFDMSCVITTLSVSVHPLDLVTVTVYVPVDVRVLAAVVDALSQLYVPPPVAVTLIEVVLQVNSVVLVLLVIPAVGVEMS